MTRGAGSRQAGLAIAFKLLLAAEKRWLGVTAYDVVALVKACVDLPDVQAEVFPSEPAPADLFAHTPSLFAGSEVPIQT